MLDALGSVGSRSHSTSGSGTQQDQPGDVNRTGPWQQWVSTLVNSPSGTDNDRPQPTPGTTGVKWGPAMLLPHCHPDTTPQNQCVCNCTRKWNNSIQTKSTKSRKIKSVFSPTRLFKYPFRNVSNNRKKHWSDIQCTYSYIYTQMRKHAYTVEYEKGRNGKRQVALPKKRFHYCKNQC